MSATKAYPIDSVSSAASAASVTPDNTTDLATKPCRGITVLVAGNLQVTFAQDADGTSVVVPAVVGVNPYAVKRVWSTSTTATGIVALY